VHAHFRGYEIIEGYSFFFVFYDSSFGISDYSGGAADQRSSPYSKMALAVIVRVIVGILWLFILVQISRMCALLCSSCVRLFQKVKFVP